MARYTRFSERIGAVPPPRTLQLESMSDELRVSLWNCLLQTPFEQRLHDRWCRIVAMILPFLKIPADTVKWGAGLCREQLKDAFFGASFQWYQVYDLLQFVADNYKGMTGGANHSFVAIVNQTLEDESAGYRFIDGVLTPIAREEEIASIEESLQRARKSRLYGTAEHFDAALRLLGQRPEPDYRNSVKESISAIESLACQLTGERAGGLHRALTKLDQRVHFHPAFKSGVASLYGYTSDGDGIRHAIMDEPNVGFDEAKFMLVACSALVNFLIAKADVHGLLPPSNMG